MSYPGGAAHWNAPTAGLDQLVSKPAHGAVAFSRSTGRYFWSSGYASAEEAQRVALAGLSAKDAELLTWGFHTYIVLVKRADGASGFAMDANAKRARKRALRQCPGGRVELVLNTNSGSCRMDFLAG
jgi:hypothetical protein